MSRVTEYTEEEEKPLRTGHGGGGGDEGGERASRLPKLSLGGRIGDFYQNVKLEMRKTTWPTRTEVWSTTVVVLIAVLFFGFYLWGVDRLVTVGFLFLEEKVRGGFFLTGFQWVVVVIVGIVSVLAMTMYFKSDRRA
ncbi:MAG TPA: preprotein translocase subunit SecE [Blastocatellia bacterium]|jgi:preprotein translocase SecE subunit|nr:preprotein translocase subunit SecE [Blastocatellia bacterium]